jgi:TolA-binding protein
MKTVLVLATWLLIVCFVAAGAGFAAEKGSAGTKNVGQETSAAADKSKAPEQEKQEYIQQIQSKIDEISKSIDQLKGNARDVTGDARARIEATVATLMSQKDATQKKLQELSSSTGAAWSDMKIGMSKAVDDLHKAYDDASKHFK